MDQKIDAAYCRLAEERGYFPLKVLYDGHDTATIVERAADMRLDVPFVVLGHGQS